MSVITDLPRLFFCYPETCIYNHPKPISSRPQWFPSFFQYLFSNKWMLDVPHRALHHRSFPCRSHVIGSATIPMTGRIRYLRRNSRYTTAVPCGTSISVIRLSLLIFFFFRTSNNANPLPTPSFIYLFIFSIILNKYANASI